LYFVNFSNEGSVEETEKNITYRNSSEYFVFAYQYNSFLLKLYKLAFSFILYNDNYSIIIYLLFLVKQHSNIIGVALLTHNDIDINIRTIFTHLICQL